MIPLFTYKESVLSGIYFTLLDPNKLEGSHELGSVCPSVQKFSWDWLIRFFSETQHGVRGPCGVVLDNRSFQKRKFCLQNGTKIGLFEFFGKLSHYFFLNLVYKEIFYYLLCSCINPILRKNLVPATWTKMLSKW